MSNFRNKFFICFKAWWIIPNQDLFFDKSKIIFLCTSAFPAFHTTNMPRKRRLTAVIKDTADNPKPKKSRRESKRSSQGEEDSNGGCRNNRRSEKQPPNVQMRVPVAVATEPVVRASSSVVSRPFANHLNLLVFVKLSMMLCDE